MLLMYINIYVHMYMYFLCFDLSCPPPEFFRLLDSIIKKQGIYHATDKGTGKYAFTFLTLSTYAIELQYLVCVYTCLSCLCV